MLPFPHGQAAYALKTEAAKSEDRPFHDTVTLRGRISRSLHCVGQWKTCHVWRETTCGKFDFKSRRLFGGASQQ